MKDITFCEYAFIPSDNKHRKKERVCVIDNFLGVYSPKIKKLTKELFITVFSS